MSLLRICANMSLRISLPLAPPSLPPHSPPFSSFHSEKGGLSPPFLSFLVSLPPLPFCFPLSLSLSPLPEWHCNAPASRWHFAALHPSPQSRIFVHRQKRSADTAAPRTLFGTPHDCVRAAAQKIVPQGSPLHVPLLSRHSSPKSTCQPRGSATKRCKHGAAKYLGNGVSERALSWSPAILAAGHQYPATQAHCLLSTVSSGSQPAKKLVRTQAGLTQQDFSRKLTLLSRFRLRKG